MNRQLSAVLTWLAACQVFLAVGARPVIAGTAEATAVQPTPLVAGPPESSNCPTPSVGHPGGAPAAGPSGWPACWTDPVNGSHVWLQPEPDPQAGQGPVGRDLFVDRLRQDARLVAGDYHNYYSLGGLGLLAAGFGVAAPLANTSADRQVRDWYQCHLRSAASGWASDAVALGVIVAAGVPAAVEASALAGLAPDGYAADGGLWEWGNRATRAYAVGLPPLLVTQFALGASRPDRGDSRWRPFHDSHGASDHAFFGAVPLLSAAAEAENPWLRYPLFLASFVPAWSRVDEDKHYLSQAVLGWWLAFVAVRSVSHTQQDFGRFSVGTVPYPDGAGVAVQVRY